MSTQQIRELTTRGPRPCPERCLWCRQMSARGQNLRRVGRSALGIRAGLKNAGCLASSAPQEPLVVPGEATGGRRAWPVSSPAAADGEVPWSPATGWREGLCPKLIGPCRGKTGREAGASGRTPERARALERRSPSGPLSKIIDSGLQEAG